MEYEITVPLHIGLYEYGYNTVERRLFITVSPRRDELTNRPYIEVVKTLLEVEGQPPAKVDCFQYISEETLYDYSLAALSGV